MRALVRLMTVPTDKRDAGWLAEALQAAIQLELSTIAPYLYAAWSIDGNADPSSCAPAIRQIAVEEMLHLGIACNLLASIGQQPDVLGVAPSYPTQLPMNVHKGLEVGLAPFSPDVLLHTFMVIEEPTDTAVEDPDFVPTGSRLIGQFYDQVRQAFRACPVTFTLGGQIDLDDYFSMGSFVITDLDGVDSAIDLIKRQGEGNSATPFEQAGDETELAHFYQFGEMFHGHRLTRTAPFSYTGAAVESPTVRAVSPAPVELPESVAFDQAYTTMLTCIHQAWRGGSDDDLGTGVSRMPALGRLAEKVIRTGFGPAFRVIPPGTVGPAPHVDRAPVADADLARVSLTTGAFRPDPSVHNAFFRDLDDWSGVHATPRVRASAATMVDIAGRWLEFAGDPSAERAWLDAISTDDARQAMALLAARQQRTVEAHYGLPVPLLTVLDGLERFGSDSLPQDPLRPGAPRHNMNGAATWFVLASFAEACVRLDVATEFWTFMMRPALCGLLNDGLFRGRFVVKGFDATPEGRYAVFQHSQRVADADLPGEIRRRYLESGL